MKKPNILFLHVDQMHAEVISAFGNRQVHTPHLDRLVGDGYAFMESYCAMPLCVPARTSWYTGRMPTEHGTVANDGWLAPDIPDLGQWLRQYGYESVYTGKWHTGRDLAQSFDVLYHGTGMGELDDSEIARSAVAYLQNRTGEAPFFLSVGFLNPHDCCLLASSHGGPGKFGFANKLADRLPSLPDNFDDDFAEGGWQTRIYRNWSLQDWRYYIYMYYRMVVMVDGEICRVYDALRRSRYADNTLVIFTSDHGEGLGYHSRVDKGFLEEEAFKVPTVVCWPGRIPASVRDRNHLVSGVDIASTICDYAGVPPLPNTAVARSWRSLLEGQDIPWRDYVIGEAPVFSPSVAVRTARYKSIIDPKTTRLYDLEQDPLETCDLARESGYAEVVKQHREHFRDYLGQINISMETAESSEERKGGNLYRTYIDWYSRVREEA